MVMDGGPLRAVVVGTSFGGRVHVPALRAAGFDVVALVGQDAARTSARAEQLQVGLGTTSLAEALGALGSAEHACVTIATPPDAHLQTVLEATRAGVHVLCEKPFALNVRDAEAMRAAAAQAGVVALVGTEFRWATAEALMARLITTGRIGEVTTASFVSFSALVAGAFPPAFNAGWWLDTARGGGILNASGFHFVDRFRTWLGEISAVSATMAVSADRPEGTAEDTYTATLHFRSGATGLIQQCSAAFGRPSRICRVVGKAGSVWMDGDAVWLADGQAMEQVAIPPDLALPAAPPPSSDPKEIFTPMELPPYTRLAERFRDLVLGRPIDAGAPATPTFDDAVRVQQVIDAVRASAAQRGGLVSLPDR
jgi:predicted dehydrogenase